MADSTIANLPKAQEMYANSLLVMEQSGQAMSISGQDFTKQISAATVELHEEYIAEFNEIKSEIEDIYDECKNVEEDLQENLPQMEEYANTATQSKEAAETWAKSSKSYAVGDTGTREGEDADNAKYYYEQTKHLSQGINGVVPMGNATFAMLSQIDKQIGYMYNVTDAFTSDATFNDGGGIYYGPGNNVIWTADGKWDVTASSSVTGIKGNAESTYSQGNYEITPDKIKLKYNFSVAVNRSNIQADDTLSVAFSKLAKYCEDFDKTVPYFGAYDQFPTTGDTDRLYVDNSVSPRPIYSWNANQNKYVQTGGEASQYAATRIVEEGDSGIWHYIKYDNGIAECWGAKSINTAITAQWGGLYISGRLDELNIDYPVEFLDTPTLMANTSATGNGAMLLASGYTPASSATSTGVYELCRGTVQNAVKTFLVNFHAIGKWK